MTVSCVFLNYFKSRNESLTKLILSFLFLQHSLKKCFILWNYFHVLIVFFLNGRDFFFELADDSIHQLIVLTCFFDTFLCDGESELLEVDHLLDGKRILFFGCVIFLRIRMVFISFHISNIILLYGARITQTSK